jgi:alpha-N-arabinofuranosidase
MAVVNVSDSKDFSTKLEGVSSDSVTVYTVTGDHPMVANTNGNEEEVVIKETKWDSKGEFTFPKHSVTMLRWKA